VAAPSSRKTPQKRVARLLRSDRTRANLYRIAGKLPPRARSALLRTARGTRDVLLSRSTGTRSAAVATGPVPKSFRVTPRPEPVTGEWPEPPEVDDPSRAVHSVLKDDGPATRYDVELFEALQNEYESKKIVEQAQGLDPVSRSERARRRLISVHDSVGLAGKRVLEFGCGAGFEVWFMAHHMGADAYGVDVIERASWSALQGDRAHLVCADITDSNPFDPDFFDRVISFSVFEHVAHPYRGLQELYTILKPGGLAYISANLYRSAVASHLYRDIYFPFPHLLFSDEIFKEYYRRKGLRERTASWVNKLTWLQYERYIAMAGFRMRMLRFSERELDEDFYRRFEGVLGRYPRWDLTKDFFTVVLEKPR
jgi:SAM-dependent methyltransferase